MEPFGRYNNMNAYLSYFGSCGGYKSDVGDSTAFCQLNDIW